MATKSDQIFNIQKEAPESNGNIPKGSEEVSESKVKTQEVSLKMTESKEETREVYESKEEMREVSESKKETLEAYKSKKETLEVYESKEETLEVYESKEETVEVHGSKEEIREAPESKEKRREVSDSDGIEREMSERNRIIPEVSESNGIIRETSDRSEIIQERSENGVIIETSHSGGITRTISHGNGHHKISYYFSVLNLRVRESRGFQAYFNTECDVLPTSWLCEMLFQKVSDDLTACIIFKLKRTDSTPDSVKVRVSLDIKDATTISLFRYPSMVKKAVVASEVLDKYLIKKFRTPEEASYFNMKLYVNVNISVVACHFNFGREPLCRLF